MLTRTHQQATRTSHVLCRHVMPVMHTILSIVVVAAVFMSCVGLSLALVLKPLE
jgi:hypothetical protein